MTPFNVIEYSGQVPDRIEISHYLNSLGLLGTAVEVGVDKGHFAITMIRRWKGAKLILIDPWKNYKGYYDMYVEPDTHQWVVNRFKKEIDRGFVEVRKLTSEEGSKQFEDNSLDFIHVDANHTYEYAKQDMNLWWPKLRPGGLMMIHDLLNGAYMGVTNAIIEFALQNKLVGDLVPQSKDKDGRMSHCASCIFRKPKQ